MATFTFITEYQGGTYISQHSANNLRNACFLWKDHVVEGRHIKHLKEKAFNKAFEADIDELPPVALEGVTNAWLFQLLIGEDMLNTHIVQTELASVDMPESRIISKSTLLP